MSKTEGEYELVLGNRQLLSAFFIIVILFGVFFTMGYVVGRNSTPGVSASTSGAQRPEAAAVPVPAASQPASAPAKEEAKEAEPADTKPVETKPVETKPVETAPVAPPEKHPAKVEAPPRRAAAPKSAPGSAGAVAVNPGPGNMYLQVMAVEQPQAGVVMDTLKQKGFPVVLAQSPNPTLFRVMVGPYADAASLGKSKAQLENAGFKPLVRK
jgi:cell division septation protein DedD